jgi:trk system potassium uptake protein TrkA
MNVIIVGGGRVGEYIADILIKNNCSVKLIENRDIIIGKLQGNIPPENIIFGSGSDPSILEAAGILKADVVAAVTGEDETNLVVATICKFEFNVPRIIARVNNPKNAWLFTADMGVDICLNEADLMAHLVVDEIGFNNVLTLMKLSHGNYSIIEIRVDGRSACANKPVKELGIPGSAVLIAVYRGKDVIIPRGDTIIYGEDVILAFVNRDTQGVITGMFSARA